MRRLKMGVISGLALSLAACAIHPVPKDVTGLSTHEIVRQIRCEARQAVFDLAIEYLTGEKQKDLEAKKMGQAYHDNIFAFHTLKPDLFRGEVRSNLALFWQTGIADNFTLQATETNNLDAGIDLFDTIRRGSATFGFTEKFDRQRQNSRAFTVTDTFGDLVNKTRESYCVNKITIENEIYPIAGRIGIRDMIKEFIYLTLFDSLTDGKKGPPTMVDSLEFQTTFSGTIAPKVVFAPAAHALTVMDAGVTATASRADDHKVVVGLALPTAAVGLLSNERTALFTAYLTASGGSAEKAAALAVQQYLALRIFTPTLPQQ